MSDTLRDQLLKAGFTSKTPDKTSGTQSRSPNQRKKNKHKTKGSDTHIPNISGPRISGANRPNQSKVADEQALKKKKLKEKIKHLIEENTVKDYAGTASFGFLVGTRVRQLFVQEKYRKQLSQGELVITRLNGNTHLVKPEIAEEILILNPQWAVFNNSENSPPAGEESDEYSDYQVPDDLIW